MQIGLRTDRGRLYQRIDRRVDRMIADGFVDEVERLLAAGITTDLPSMHSAGYRQLAGYLHGECSLAEAIQQTKYATHQLAKRQETWFRKQKGIQWMEIGIDTVVSVGEEIEGFYKECGRRCRCQASEGATNCGGEGHP